MKPKNSVIWGFVIFLVLAGSFFVWTNTDTIGAVVSSDKKEGNLDVVSCPAGVEGELYADCFVWRAGNYGDKIGSLQDLSDDTAKKLCDELLSKYDGC